MIFSILSLLISLTLFLGVLALQRRKEQLEVKTAYQVYQSFFASFFVYFVLLALANSLPMSPLIAQLMFYLALYIFLFIGLGFMLLFTLRVSGYIWFANVVFGLVSTLGIAMFLYRITNMPMLPAAPVGALFFYRNPAYTTGEIALSVVGIIITATSFMVPLFRIGVAAVSSAIRRRSFFMAQGTTLAMVGGVGYFTSHLLNTALVPYAVVVSMVPAAIGFFLMAFPLLFHSTTKE